MPWQVRLFNPWRPHDTLISKLVKSYYFFRHWAPVLAAALLGAAAQAQPTAPYLKVGGCSMGFGSMALRADGTLWGWGDNRHGQAGNGVVSNYRVVPTLVSRPAAAAAGTTWTDFTLSNVFAIGLRSDGTLWAWGDNYGSFGDGTQISHFTPSLVPAPAAAAAGTVWTQVSSGATHTLALRSDGTLWGWGGNYFGTVGDGTSTDRLLPVLIPTPTGAAAGTTWTQVSCGAYHTLALRSDGTLWSWGNNVFGQLGHSMGQGTQTGLPTTLVPAPAGATPGSRWVRVVGGNDHTLALRSDGTLWSWGNGYTGLTMNQIPTPTGAAAGTTWTEFAAGYIFSAALRSDGTLWTWGLNGYGQLAVNTTASYTTPQREFTRSTWSHVGAGSGHTLAVDLPGLVYGSGDNAQAELGDGTTTGRLLFARSLAPMLATAPAQPAAVQALPYPNPAREYCYLPGASAAANLRLHNALGQLVRETVPTADHSLDVRGLPAGLYLLTVQEPARPAYTVRVVVE